MNIEQNTCKGKSTCKDKFVLQWHLTEKCNLKCKHCYQNEQPCEEISQINKIEIIHKFYEFIQSNNFRGHINFTGGEPLLVKDALYELTEECDKLGITYGILTNGTMITEEIADKLSNMKKLSFIQMSLEGGKKTNDNIRGKGTYDKIMRSIRLLRKRHIQTMISFTCSENNYKELRKLIWVCRLHKVDRFWTDRYVPINNKDINTITTEHYKQVVKTLVQESKLNKLGTKVECNRSLQCLAVGNGYKCSAGKRLLALLPNGNLLPCRRLPINIGNILKIKFEQTIENSEKQLKELEIQDSECKECIYKQKCNNGAKCITYAIKGNIGSKDINCWFK